MSIPFCATVHKLLLSRGKDQKGLGENAPFVQIFEKQKEDGRTAYRLMSEHHKGGLGIALRYGWKTPDGREVLSEVVMSKNGEVLHHIGTKVDAHGHIVEIWRLKDGKAERQLAKYFYTPDESRGKEVEKDGKKAMLYPVGYLLTAQEEDGQHWLYLTPHAENNTICNRESSSGRVCACSPTNYCSVSARPASARNNSWTDAESRFHPDRAPFLFPPLRGLRESGRLSGGARGFDRRLHSEPLHFDQTCVGKRQKIKSTSLPVQIAKKRPLRSRFSGIKGNEIPKPTWSCVGGYTV
ncbi:MAG: hypothetical protein LBU11_00755 [Zoogloeaceae bacterium]|jgi:hypothetical protein|nr:hypothetical protein [Zoogloeaceae bacterium]